MKEKATIKEKAEYVEMRKIIDKQTRAIALRDEEITNLKKAPAKEMYNVNGHAYSYPDLKDRPLSEEEKSIMGKLLYDIRDLARCATASLSGLGAILDISEGSRGNEFFEGGEYSFDHVTWLHIAALQNINEMTTAIEIYEDFENVAYRAKKDLRKNN